MAVLRRQTDVFIQIEGCDLRKVEPFLPVHPHEFPVQPNRARAGGQSKHRIRLGVEQFGHELSGLARQFFIG